MTRKTAELDPMLWKKLALLVNVEGEDWEAQVRSLQLSFSEARSLLVALKTSKTRLEAQTGQSEEVFQAWSWDQWCRMVHLLESLKTDPAHKAEVIPLLKECRQHPAYAVYTQLLAAVQTSPSSPAPAAEQGEDDSRRAKVKEVEDAILGQRTVMVERMDGGRCELIPSRVVYLDGELSLVAEDSHDHGLVALRFAEMAKVVAVGRQKAVRAHPHEVEEFIQALRSMGETETRLILKIKDPARFNVFPDHHFLGRPCLITNPEGEVIWAAYVEPCDELYAWLDTLGDEVEIMDPTGFIAEYAAYREAKSRKMA